MNPFNPKKRVSSPSGGKDLSDVLRDGGPDSAFLRFIVLLLVQARQDHATELVIGAASPSGDTPMRYKVEDGWHDLPPFPARIRPNVIAELARMAKIPVGQFPNKGVLDVALGNVRLKWTVGITSADGECRLVRVLD